MTTNAVQSKLVTSQEYTFAGKRPVGNLVSPAPSKPGFKPMRSGFGRFHSVDQSVSSRTRGEDQETQQATAILEQLTSSFAGEQTSSDLFPDRFTPNHRKVSESLPRRLSLPLSNKPSRSHRSGRVRTRGGGRDGRALDRVRKLSADDKKTNIRYVMTSSNIRERVQKRGGITERRIALMPEFGSTLFATMSRSAHVFPRSTPVKPTSSIANKLKTSPSQKPALLTPEYEKVGKSDVKHVVYFKKKNESTLPRTTDQALARLVTGKSGDRTVLSISRPRATTNPSTKTSSVEDGKSAVRVGMPSLILTKLPSEALPGANDKSSLES